MMSYWVLFIGIAVVSWLVQMNLQNKFKKYSKIPTGNGMTGRDVALKMLHDNGIYDVQVTHTPGRLTDHYNPTNKTVNLSEGVYESNSIMAANTWKVAWWERDVDTLCSMHVCMLR